MIKARKMQKKRMKLFIRNLPSSEKLYMLKNVYDDKGKWVGTKKEYIGTVSEIVTDDVTVNET